METQDVIAVIPWTRWLTWLFQVMPVFFLVGGYVNALGWQSARRRHENYTAWLARRLQRLVLPVLPVLAAWTLIGAFFTASSTKYLSPPAFSKTPPNSRSCPPGSSSSTSS